MTSTHYEDGIYREKDLLIDLRSAVSHKQFDNINHGLDCMHKVDFIFETPKSVIFVEIKDPDHPQARSEGLQKFRDKFQSDELRIDLTYKIRDSFLYELAMDNINKNVYYYVLIAMNTLDDTLLSNITNLLKDDIPVEGPPNNPWKQKFVHGCAIFNIKTWNASTLGQKFPISRISQASNSGVPA